ncbi:hypothetical protein AAFF_G00123650 [Aldrovandia affinis]|uniref:Uncharacterized protein n=1 Tax=Aldrovandia affinis TaxID=143900 RepID=A0AAD7WAU2_9TELE|nr:hypothetical protein AAFF_G00123650 [Aldrovandia affinis]
MNKANPNKANRANKQQRGVTAARSGASRRRPGCVLIAKTIIAPRDRGAGSRRAGHHLALFITFVFLALRGRADGGVTHSQTVERTFGQFVDAVYGL